MPRPKTNKGGPEGPPELIDLAVGGELSRRKLPECDAQRLAASGARFPGDERVGEVRHDCLATHPCQPLAART